jgi:uncharacterized membrane protein
MSPLAHFGVVEDEWLSSVCDGITAGASALFMKVKINGPRQTAIIALCYARVS